MYQRYAYLKSCFFRKAKTQKKTCKQKEADRAIVFVLCKRCHDGLENG